MSSKPSGLLRLAWETIRRAAQIFLWRGAGFHSNILVTLAPDLNDCKNACVREIISNIDIIFAISQQQHLSIGNAMLWPLTVAGCECSLYTNGWDLDIIRLLRSLEDNYSMRHVPKVRAILQSLWMQRHTYTATIGTESEPALPHLSLEKMARQAGLTIALL